jgi:hypothetical protein
MSPNVQWLTAQKMCLSFILTTMTKKDKYETASADMWSYYSETESHQTFFFILSGVGLSPLCIAAITGLLYQPQMIDDGDCGAIGGMRLTGETEVLGENLPQRHFLHHKSHMTRPGLEPWQLQWEASD